MAVSFCSVCWELYVKMACQPEKKTLTRNAFVIITSSGPIAKSQSVPAAAIRPVRTSWMPAYSGNLGRLGGASAAKEGDGKLCIDMESLSCFVRELICAASSVSVGADVAILGGKEDDYDDSRS